MGQDFLNVQYYVVIYVIYLYCIDTKLPFQTSYSAPQSLRRKSRAAYSLQRILRGGQTNRQVSIICLGGELLFQLVCPLSICHSQTPSFTHKLPHTLTNSLIHPKTPSFTHKLPHSPTNTLIYSRTPSFTHKHPHLLTNSLLTHKLTPTEVLFALYHSKQWS